MIESMRHILQRPSAYATVAAVASVLHGATASAGAANYPYLSWQDEFDGAAVETTRWSYDLGTGSQHGLTGWGNNELQYYTNRVQNAAVSGGMLQITARRETFGGQAYTSARLKTQGKFSQAGGRFEIRASLPTGQGLWPAIWMLPANDTYGGWAASGEIDIMEARGQHPDRVAGTIHFGGPWPNNTQSSATRILPAGQTIAQFHTYALEWDTSGSPEIRWYVDEVLYATRNSWWSTGGAYPAPFDKPFFMLLNLAVGGDYVGSPNASTPFPAMMQVDYVRAFTAGPPAITLAAASGTLTQAAVGNPLIAAAGSVTKTGNGTMRLTATNTHTGPTTVTQGTLELANPAALSSSAVTVAAGAKLTVGPQVAAVVPALINNGLVDVGLGGLRVTAGQTAIGIVAGIKAGRNNGTWSGTSGIGSSAAAATSDRAVGWVDNGGGSFTVAFAAAGDWNLNGVVDFDDVLQFVSRGLYDTGRPATWAEGDFDYNGVVDFDDVVASVSANLFDTGPYSSALAAAAVPGLGSGVAVPEPATWLPCAAGIGCMAGEAWRRRKAARQQSGHRETKSIT
jgi:autotransporter-associated beta strand protein